MYAGDEQDLFHDTEVLGEPTALVQRVFDDIIVPLSNAFVAL
jgi:hypothetical protein